MHTSTVTVAIIDPNVTVSDAFSQREDTDFRIEWFSGSGAGGQHRNRHCNSCRLIHIPTGIMETRQGRERISNLRDAKDALIKTLDKAAAGESRESIQADRKFQVGSGMRGDKTKTLHFQYDEAVHHTTKKRMSAKKYMKGYMDELWQ